MTYSKWSSLEKWQSFVDSNPKFAAVNVNALERVASLANNGIVSKVLRFTYGMYNAVFDVRFENDVSWIFRVHCVETGVDSACTKAKIESNVATMRLIRCRTSIPIPEIYAFESDQTTSPIGAGYILMEAMTGIEVGGGGQMDVDDLNVVYSQLADVVWQLSSVVFPKVGRIFQSADGEFHVGPFVDAHGNYYGPFSTSVEFFNYEASKIPASHREWRSKTREDEKKSLQACALYEHAASCLSDHDSASFPIAHGDLGIQNCLFERDSDGNLRLSAVLDWDSAHTATWLEFCFFPNFLEVRWPTLEAGRYSPLVLDKIKRNQIIFLESLARLEAANSAKPLPSRPSPLNTLYDSPPVRVAEFILEYSDPYYQCDADLVRKYLIAWRRVFIEE
jgi:hypothetical protein